VQQVKTSDEELVHLARTSDQEIYGILVRRYQDKLWRYALYLTNDEALASDATQNALIKGFVNLQSFKLNRSFSSWIYRITHNEAMNILRKNKHQVKLSDIDWKKIDSSIDIEDSYIAKIDHQQIHQALAQMPLEYRSPLALFFLDHKSYSEISQIMRLPTSTVGTRIRRGKRMLHQFISQER
jgi:RNA polymerase sigma-70 factor (ECF subfamily)